MIIDSLVNFKLLQLQDSFSQFSIQDLLVGTYYTAQHYSAIQYIHESKQSSVTFIVCLDVSHTRSECRSWDPLTSTVQVVHYFELPLMSCTLITNYRYDSLIFDGGGDSWSTVTVVISSPSRVRVRVTHSRYST